jgi:hypothetical protein
MSTKNWQVFFDDGCGFHKTALGAVKRPEVFTPEIIQNIAAMGIEKYFMAIFTKRGQLPLNHTMTDLVNTAVSINLPIDRELMEILLYFDQLQQICSQDNFKIIQPSKSDIPKFLKALQDISTLAKKELQIETT